LGKGGGGRPKERNRVRRGDGDYIEGKKGGRGDIVT